MRPLINQSPSYLYQGLFYHLGVNRGAVYFV